MIDNRPRCQNPNCGKVIAEYIKGTLVLVHRCDKNTRFLNVFSDEDLTKLNKCGIAINKSTLQI